MLLFREHSVRHSQTSFAQAHCSSGTGGNSCGIASLSIMASARLKFAIESTITNIPAANILFMTFSPFGFDQGLFSGFRFSFS
jgi:hypothetical protein